MHFYAAKATFRSSTKERTKLLCYILLYKLLCSTFSNCVSSLVEFWGSCRIFTVSREWKPFHNKYFFSKLTVNHFFVCLWCAICILQSSRNQLTMSWRRWCWNRIFVVTRDVHIDFGSLHRNKL